MLYCWNLDFNHSGKIGVEVLCQCQPKPPPSYKWVPYSLEGFPRKLTEVILVKEGISIRTLDSINERDMEDW